MDMKMLTTATIACCPWGRPVLKQSISSIRRARQSWVKRLSGWKCGISSSCVNLFCKGQRSRFWKKGPRKLQCEKTSLRFFFAGAWRDAHQKCFGARTLSSLPASLRLWEGIPVDSCWLGKKYVPPVLSFSREILTFLCCLDFHQAVYSILFVYLPHCLSFYSYIWDVCILTIHMPICLVVPIFLSLCLPSYFSITQLPNCWSINSSIRPSIHPHGVFNLHGAFLNLCEF